MNKEIAKLGFVLALLCGSALLVAQSANDTDQAQATAGDSASAQEQEELENESQAQDSSGQDVAQVEEEETSSARFIPTEELSQDLGASFPVDI